MFLSEKIRKLNRRRIDAMRGFALFLSKFVFDKKNLVSEVNCEKHILVFRLDDKLGDSVVATGFLRELKFHTKAKVTVLSGGASVELYQNLPYVDHVLTAKKGMLSTLKIFIKLSGQKYFALINTSHLLSPRVYFLFRYLRAYRKIGLQNKDSQIFSDHIEFDSKMTSVVDRYRAILSSLGIETSKLEYDFYISPESQKKAQDWFTQKSFSGPKIVVNAFAAARMRSLSQATLKSVFESLASEINWIFIGAPDQLQTLKNWFSTSQNKIFFYDIAKNVEQSAACVQLADVVVSPDTAWVHIACALKKNLVAIYRADLPEAKELNAQIWQPYGTQSRVVLARNDGSEDPDINLVNPQEVADAIAIYLK